MSLIFLNGKFVSLKDAKVPILDRGFQYGDGVFETMRSYDGKVFKLEQHLDRLLTSLKILKIKSPYAKNKLSFYVYKSMSINRLKDAYIKLMITRGVSSTGIDIPRVDKPAIIIYTMPLKRIPEEIYKKGIKVNFACINKNERSFTARIKSLNYLDNILAKDEAKGGGFDDAIFVNSSGYVCEATTSNLFMIKKGVIITPPPTAGLLPGITRDVVIGLVKKYFKDKICERNIKIEELSSADETFLTNSILEIVPVVKLGKKRIGNGKAGIVTRIIHALYRIQIAL